jgi:hypothetical protein
MKPCDDGEPLPPTRMDLREAFELVRKEEDDEPTKH